MNSDTIKTEPIIFENKNEALAVFPPDKGKAENVVKELNLKPYNAVILILGGADSLDEKLIPRLTQLFARGIARSASETNAVIIDGATRAGIIAMMGEGVAGRGAESEVIGVAPSNMITYPGSSTKGTPLEPNHSHFVLVEGNEWGSETSMIFNLVSALTSKKEEPSNLNGRPQRQNLTKDKKPALAILAGGGQITRSEVLNTVRRNIPIIIVEGSGGFADEIVAARQASPDDPVMAEIIADGNLHFHKLSDSVKGIERLIIRELGIDKVLTQAWETFAEYDLNATLQQKKFGRIQKAILIVGVIGTALVIIQQVWGVRDIRSHDLLSIRELFQNKQNKSISGWQWLIWSSVYYLLILIPIVLTVLITAVNRFKQGNKWLLLRAGAESIKREIFRYRSRAMYYTENAEQQLSAKIEDITRRTMRTEVNLSSLIPYNKDNGFPPYMYAAQGEDDGFNYLNPDRYVEVRLNDQLNFFKRKSLLLERELKQLYWATFIIGGIGTFLAAIGYQVWIALTTSIAAAFGTYLGYRQIENTLTKYNQAATDLSNVKAWWNALSAEDQSLQANIDSLVEHTEQVLQSELDGWVQQMQNALAELRKEQETPKEIEEKKEPVESVKPAGEKKNEQGKTEARAAGVQKENETTTEEVTDKAGTEETKLGAPEAQKENQTSEEATETLGTEVINAEATGDKRENQTVDGMATKIDEEASKPETTEAVIRVNLPQIERARKGMKS